MSEKEREMYPPKSKDYDQESSNLKTSSKCRNFKIQIKLLIIVVSIILFILTISLLLYYLLQPSKTWYSSTIDIDTDVGVVRGQKEKVNIRGKLVDVYSFKGIPYAIPPVGKLRFMNPVPFNKTNGWKGVYNASSFGDSCVQLRNGIITGSEDCLFLNVFTPTLIKKTNLSVFVWIHGGYLLYGSGNDFGEYPDTEFVSSMNVVGVSMNYRLNAFGFLTLKELWVKNNSYGNYGIQDQILALKWVRANIKNFGGNPNSITIVGASSGCSAVYAILASPSADGLFQRAVCMSGPPLLKRNYLQAAIDNRIFINKSKCRQVPEKYIKECFYNLSKKELINAIPFYEYPSWFFVGSDDIPRRGEKYGSMLVVDPILFKTPPNEVKNLSYPTKSKVYVLLGTMAQEIGIAPPKLFYNSTWQDFENYTKPRFNEFSAGLYNKIVNELYANLTLPNKTRDQSIQYLYESIVSDVRMTCPNAKLAKDINLSQKHEVFHYVITSQPSHLAVSKAYGRQYAFHTWDTWALFNFKKEKYVPSQRDILFQKTLRENIKNFVEHGKLINPNWTSDLTGIFNEKGNVIIKQEYHKVQCDFWNNPKNGFTNYAWNN